MSGRSSTPHGVSYEIPIVEPRWGSLYPGTATRRVLRDAGLCCGTALRFFHSGSQQSVQNCRRLCVLGRVDVQTERRLRVGPVPAGRMVDRRPAGTGPTSDLLRQLDGRIREISENAAPQMSTRPRSTGSVVHPRFTAGVVLTTSRCGFRSAQSVVKCPVPKGRPHIAPSVSSGYLFLRSCQAPTGATASRSTCRPFGTQIRIFLPLTTD